VFQKVILLLNYVEAVALQVMVHCAIITFVVDTVCDDVFEIGVLLERTNQIGIMAVADYIGNTT
jgi:hypothetical protein